MVKKTATQETTTATAAVPAKKVARKPTAKPVTRQEPVRAVGESEGRPTASPEALNPAAFAGGQGSGAGIPTHSHTTYGNRGFNGMVVPPNHNNEGLPPRTTNFAGPVNVPLILLTHQLLPIGKAQGQDMFKQLFSPLILTSGRSASPVFCEPRSQQQFVKFVETFGVLVKTDGFERIPACTYWNGFASEIFSMTSYANLIKSMIVSRFMSWANDLTSTVHVSFDYIRIHGFALRHVCDDVWTLTLTFYEEDQTHREIHNLQNFNNHGRHDAPWNRGGLSNRRLFEVIQPINLAK